MGDDTIGELVQEVLKVISERKIQLDMMRETLNKQHPEVDD